ncbi:hypothetical protein BTVI_90218 [Pitangus sulphuratus]|nr:hypothetical protein BTVI_90218 [Pitangus sulphuratus]
MAPVAPETPPDIQPEPPLTQLKAMSSHPLVTWKKRLIPIWLQPPFSLPDVCWKCNTVERKQSRRLLEYVEEETEKIMEQIFLGTVMQHIQNNQGIRPSQHGFRKDRCCLTNLTAFYDNMFNLVDERYSQWLSVTVDIEQQVVTSGITQGSILGPLDILDILDIGYLHQEHSQSLLTPNSVWK